MNKLKEILKQRKSKKGFTLIELLAVIVVLAIVLVVTIPSVLNSMKNAKSKQANNAIDAIKDYMNKQYEICKLGTGEFSQGKYHDEFFNDDCTLNMEKATSDSILDASGISKDIISGISGYRYDNGKFIIDSIVYGNSVSELSDNPDNNTAASFITNLYTNEEKTIVTNNGIEYNTAPSVSLMNDRLGGTTSIDGGNIRYYGATPNNYVWLGDTYTENMTIGSTQVHAEEKKLWRIIGVFDGKLKLVTDVPISTQGLSWDTSGSSVNNGYGINEWSQSDLMKLLNPGYEDESINNSLYWTKGSGTVYNSWRNSTTPNVSFASTGLSDSEKKMIDEVTWYTGAYDNISYADVHYKKEREDMGKICSSGTNCNDTVARTKEWSGKVGLISASDYGYSVDLNSCNTTLNNYENSDCANNNWLVNGKYYWTMSPRAYSYDAVSVFYVQGIGYLGSNIAGSVASVRPAVYLKSGVSISSGNGSQSDPYELSYQ